MAAIVVSEIIERLSPNIAPETTAPMHNAPAIPVLSLIPTAIGAKAAMVPTEVPIAVEHPIINKPATATEGGKMESEKFTVLSTPPAACTAPENPPAITKTRHIIITLESPIL